MFGDERHGDRHHSQPWPIAAPAGAHRRGGLSRPVIVVTDGELEDAGDLPPELLGRASVRTMRPEPRAGLRPVQRGRPRRASPRATPSCSRSRPGRSAGAAAESLAVEVALGSQVGASGRLRLARAPPRSRSRLFLRRRSGRVTTSSPSGSPESRTTSPAPTPGCISSPSRRPPASSCSRRPADWDSRFLYAALRDVARLPVRGYVQLDAGRWRSMSDLSAVGTDRVRQAARGADLLILKGDPGSMAEGTRARGIWRWPSGETGIAPVAGDWYLSAAGSLPDRRGVSRRAGGLVPSGDAAQSRRGRSRGLGRTHRAARPSGRRAPGGDRPAVRPGANRVCSGRWAVAVGIPWRIQRAELPHLGGLHRELAARRRRLRAGRRVSRSAPWCRTADPWYSNGRARARPSRRRSSGPDRGVPRTDTLRFDGAGRASVRLPPGEYRYRFAGGGGGTVAVEDLLRRAASRRPSP